MSIDEQYFLKSERVGFRTWTFDDMDMAIKLWGNADVTKYTGGPFSNSQIQRKLLIERAILRQHNIQNWPIFLLDNHEFIGSCGLQPYKPKEKVYEIGLHIQPDYWRNGYAKEAAQTVITHAFDNLDATGVYAGHHPENEAYEAMLKKLGFQYTHDEYYETTGLDHPSYLFTK
jgi:[ribosomal protein S5]-alanine N-acetyltransferase